SAESGMRSAESGIRDQGSGISEIAPAPDSAFRTPHSALRIPHSALRIRPAPRLPLLILLPGPGAMARAVQRLLWPPPRWLRLRYALASRAPLGPARRAHLLRLLRTRSTN